MRPPPGSTDADDRDAACQDALEPELSRLFQTAVAAGWHPAEVLTAIRALTVSEMRGRAGADATRETLRAALRAV